MGEIDYVALASAVKSYAIDHYNDGGWDVIVECMALGTIAHELMAARVETADDAIGFYSTGTVPVWAERQADARNSAF